MIRVSAVFAVLLSAVALYLFLGHRAQPVVGSYKDERAFWLQEIRDRGGKQAYREMVTRYASLLDPTAHEYAHVFGDALYEVEGLNGFEDCGPDYVWGCYHSFIERAIVQEGMQVLTVLSAHCKNIERGDAQECEHGIGHGILSHLGVSHLTQGLVECESLGALTYGCKSGVLMEYFNGNIHENRSPAAYTESKKYGPCAELSARDRPICYRRLPNWWALTFKGDAETRLAFLSRNCLDIQNQTYRDACLIGVGYNETSQVDFDTTQARKKCDTLKDPHNVTMCLYGGVLAIFQNTPLRDRAIDLCPSGDLRQCVSFSERLLGTSEAGLSLPDR